MLENIVTEQGKLLSYTARWTPQEARRYLVGNTRAVLGRIARTVQRAVKTVTPVNFGTLRANIHAEEQDAGIDSPGHWFVGIWAQMRTQNPEVFKYARIVHEGHGPYTVRPVRARALHWQERGGRYRYTGGRLTGYTAVGSGRGQTVDHFAKFVNIPAVQGIPFLMWGRQLAQPAITAQLNSLR